VLVVAVAVLVVVVNVPLLLLLLLLLLLPTCDAPTVMATSVKGSMVLPKCLLYL